jgi:hypothetical protein
MDCANAARLTAEFGRRKRAYSSAVELLFSVGYMATDAEHRRLKAAVEDARFDFEVVRRELEEAQAETVEAPSPPADHQRAAETSGL